MYNEHGVFISFKASSLVAPKCRNCSLPQQQTNLQTKLCHTMINAISRYYELLFTTFFFHVTHIVREIFARQIILKQRRQYKFEGGKKVILSCQNQMKKHLLWVQFNMVEVSSLFEPIFGSQYAFYHII